MPTIHFVPAIFCPADLPRWARRHPEVVELCRSNLGFRVRVYEARTRWHRKLLIRYAQKIIQERENR